MRRFFALSRSVHGLLDLAMTGFAALLWLGDFPSWQVLALALITAWAGYTAVYALNDLVGLRFDREKYAITGVNAGYSVETSVLRYPLARKLVSVRAGMVWCASWFAVSLIGAWLLNPWLLVILCVAALLEALYCKLLKTSHWRVLVSGLVKSAGPVAAVFVVVPRPAPGPLVLMAAWLMLWEIGGQNIPADWNDMEEDRRIGARTLPLVLGPRRAASVIVASLSLVVLMSLLLPLASPLDLGWTYEACVAMAGCVLLWWPARQLWRERAAHRAARLFDRASFYPLALLAIMTTTLLWHAYARPA